MNCQNCKHWVFGKCIIQNAAMGKNSLCNAWELSLSWEQVAEKQPATDRTAELQERIAKLERDAANNASSIHNIMTMLDINDETHGVSDDMYKTAHHLAYKLRSRVEELEATIDQLIEAGDAAINAQPTWVREEDSWDKLIANIRKECEK